MWPPVHGGSMWASFHHTAAAPILPSSSLDPNSGRVMELTITTTTTTTTTTTIIIITTCTMTQRQWTTEMYQNSLKPAISEITEAAHPPAYTQIAESRIN